MIDFTRCALSCLHFITLPAELGLLAGLTEVRISSNYKNLTGPIPSELGRLTLLRRLSLPVNNLTGSLPSEIGCLRLLTRLDLWNNPIPSMDEHGLIGTIPIQIGHLTNLVDLIFISEKGTS